MNFISSKSNIKIKETAKLFSSSKHRSQNGLFVIEGIRLCFDAYKSGVKIKSVFITENCLEKCKNDAEKVIDYAEESYIVTTEVMKYISDTVSPQGIVCVCEFITAKVEVSDNLKAAVLFDIADPSNIGTISRTAEAFGIDILIVCGGCDIYNPKALRASMGALFRLPVLNFNEDEVFKFFKKNDIISFASTPKSTAEKVTEISFPNKAAMLIGNEANGLREEIIQKCDRAVTIPMLGRAESLNAAAAAAILLFELVREGL